jgi:hypothetical protein
MAGQQADIRGQIQMVEETDDMWDSTTILSLDSQQKQQGEINGDGGSLEEREWIPRPYHTPKDVPPLRQRQNLPPKMKKVQDYTFHQPYARKIPLESRLSDSAPELCSSFSLSSSRSSSPSTKKSILQTRRIPTVSKRKKYLDEDLITRKDGSDDLFMICNRMDRANIIHRGHVENWWQGESSPKKNLGASCPDFGLFDSSTVYDEKTTKDLGKTPEASWSPNWNEAQTGGEPLGVYPTQEQRTKVTDESESRLRTPTDTRDTPKFPVALVCLSKQSMNDSTMSDVTITLEMISSTRNKAFSIPPQIYLKPAVQGEGQRPILVWSKNDDDAVKNGSDWLVIVATGWSDDDKVETYHVHKFVLGYGPRAGLFFRNEFRAARKSNDGATGDTTEASYSIIETDTLTASLFPDMLDYIYSLHTTSKQSLFDGMDRQQSSALSQLGKRLGVRGLSEAPLETTVSS